MKIFFLLPLLMLSGCPAKSTFIAFILEGDFSSLDKKFLDVEQLKRKQLKFDKTWSLEENCNIRNPHSRRSDYIATCLKGRKIYVIAQYYLSYCGTPDDYKSCIWKDEKPANEVAMEHLQVFKAVKTKLKQENINFQESKLREFTLNSFNNEFE